MPKQGKNIYLRKDGRWEGRYIKDRIAGKTKHRKIHESAEFVPVTRLWRQVGFRNFTLCYYSIEQRTLDLWRSKS